MARTTAGNVRILSDDFADMTDAQLSPHILTAFTIINDQGIAADSGTTSTKLELIERWLAAHFATVFVREATREKAGPVAAEYEGNAKPGERLDSTRFGKNAIMLDDTGALAKLSDSKVKKQTASAKSLWTEPNS